MPRHLAQAVTVVGTVGAPSWCTDIRRFAESGAKRPGKITARVAASREKLRRTQICRGRGTFNRTPGRVSTTMAIENIFSPRARYVIVIKIAAAERHVASRARDRFIPFASEFMENDASRSGRLYTRARIIAKYFVSASRTRGYFHGGIQFYVVLFRFIPPTV